MPEGPALGLHPRGVFQGVFNVTDCQLQSDLSNQIVVRTREIAQALGLSVYRSRPDEGLLRHLVIRQAATTSDVLVILVARREDPALVELARQLREAFPVIIGRKRSEERGGEGRDRGRFEATHQCPLQR